MKTELKFMDQIPANFLIMMLGFFAAASLVAAIAYARKHHRVRQTVNPRRDYLRRRERSEQHRRHRRHGSSERPET